MTTIKLSKMETVAYAMPNAAFTDLLAQMRKLEGAVVKRESTTATVRLVHGEKSKTMLMAMQHSNRKVWLVRAIAGLVSVKGE